MSHAQMSRAQAAKEQCGTKLKLEKVKKRESEKVSRKNKGRECRERKRKRENKGEEKRERKKTTLFT